MLLKKINFFLNAYNQKSHLGQTHLKMTTKSMAIFLFTDAIDAHWQM